MIIILFLIIEIQAPIVMLSFLGCMDQHPGPDLRLEWRIFTLVQLTTDLVVVKF